MKQLLIHVGPHKTGSTAIQRVLAAEAERLAAQGWTLETFCDIENGSAHRFADILSAGQFAAASPYLQTLARAQGSVILSSENFSRMRAAHVSFFADAIEADSVRVVYYLRSPLFRLQSAWRERVKHGYRYSFVEFLAGRLLRPFQDAEINDFIKMTPWAQSFGVESLDIPLYDQIDEAAAHFMGAYFPSLDNIATFPSARINTSMDMVRIEIYRALCGHQVHLPRHEAYKAHINSLYQGVTRVIENGDYIRKLTFSLDNPVVRNIERRIAEQFRDRITPRPTDDVVFADRETTWSYLAPEIWFQNRDLAVAILNLKDQLERDCGPPVFDRRLAAL